MGGKIQVWVDCNSPYSRFAVLHLRRYAQQLASNDIVYEIHPVFINGLNSGSGNKPPWMLPAKAKYGPFDLQRAEKFFGTNKMSPPDAFPLSTLLALRSMCYIKASFEKDRYEKSFLELWIAAWEQNTDISKPELLAGVLGRHFSDSEVKTILSAATEQKWKDQLNQNTKTALEQGAFGAPWWWVRNAEGKEEPFFGSDRFHYMWEYLGIPHRDFEVLAAGSNSAKL